MFRKDLIDVLLDNPMSVAQLSRELGPPAKTIKENLEHLLKSLKHTEFEAHIEPARCRECGFVFRADKLQKPGKCPQCRGRQIEAPIIEIRTRKQGR